MGKIVHLAGFRMLLYLDNWLILVKSKEEILRARQVVLGLTKELGININTEKSHLEPSQHTTNLGVDIGTASV